MNRPVAAYHISAHNGQMYVQFSAIAQSSCDAAIAAAELFGDEPCSITVTPRQVTQ